MDIKKVLYISQEIDPYLASTPMGVFGRELAQGLQEKGAEVRTFMPRYGAINERRNQLHEVIRLSGLNIDIDDNDHPLIIKVATLQPSRLQVYFIDNDDYFVRHTPGQPLETETSPEDNDERGIFFVRGVAETVKKLRWEPEIVHVTGWIAALAPLYIKHIYNEEPAFRSSKVVVSLFNKPFDGTLDARMVEKLGMEGFTAEQLKALTDGEGNVDYVKLNKIAIDYADGIVESSEDVDPEVLAYAEASGKPFLRLADAQPGDAAAYYTFYQSL